MIALGILVVIAVALLVYVARAQKKRGALSMAKQNELRAQWTQAQALQDVHRQVLEMDKVVDGLLSALGYRGSFADKLKQAGPRIENLDALWSAHKLRNRIAHEPGITISASEATKAASAFKTVLNRFVRL